MTVIMACDENQSAWEYPEKHHGRFSYYLMKSLERVPAGNPPRDLTPGAVYDEIATSWPREWHKTQQPQMFAAMDGTFNLRRSQVPILRPNVNPVTTVQSLQERARLEYAKGKVDAADQTYQLGIILLSTPATVSAEEKRLLGQLHAEHACVLYRIRGEEAAKKRRQRPGLVPDDAALHVLAGYRLSAKKAFAKAVIEFRAALDLQASTDQPIEILAGYGGSLYKVERYVEAGPLLENAALDF